MSILKYLQESLINEKILDESQKEAKQIAQSPKYPNFNDEDFNKLKSQLDVEQYKYMGWVARNWDNLPQDKIGHLLKIHDQYVGKSGFNLNPMNHYSDVKDWVNAVQATEKASQFKSSETPSSERINTIWTSEDGKIKVVVPQTKSASIKSGRGSKWCTAANVSPGIDYDSQHEFCKYVLDKQGLMIYIINDNISENDPFHKTAIRLTDKDNDGKPKIDEIRDMKNSANYRSGYGWDKTFDGYLNKYNIPLMEILSTTHHEIENLNTEREKYKIEKEFLRHVINSEYEDMQKMIDDGYIPHSSALNTAIAKNDTEMVKFLLKFKTVKADDNTMAYTVKYAVRNDNKDLINIISSLKGVTYKNVDLNDALNTQNETVIELTLQAGVKPNSITLNNAIDTGNENIVNRTLQIDGAKPDEDTLSRALRTGNENIVNRILQIDGVEADEYTLNVACGTENENIVKRILQMDGVTPDENTLNSAIDSKNEKIINLVLQAGAKPNEETLYYAVKANNKDIVKYLFQIGVKPKGSTLSSAMSSKPYDPDMVKLILDAGAPTYISTLNTAIRTNNPDIVKLILDALDADTTPNTDSIDTAISTNNPDIVKLILDAGREFYRENYKENTGRLALETKNPEIIKLVLSSYDIWDSMITHAVDYSDFETFKAVVDAGADLSFYRDEDLYKMAERLDNNNVFDVDEKLDLIKQWLNNEEEKEA